jgi:hypothetical protein
MPSTRGSSFAAESVAARVKRDMRPAAVDACRRMQEMSADAYEEDTFVRPSSSSSSSSAAAASGMRTAVVSHRYMLRSMRR